MSRTFTDIFGDKMDVKVFEGSVMLAPQQVSGEEHCVMFFTPKTARRVATAMLCAASESGASTRRKAFTKPKAKT